MRRFASRVGIGIGSGGWTVCRWQRFGLETPPASDSPPCGALWCACMRALNMGSERFRPSLVCPWTFSGVLEAWFVPRRACSGSERIARAGRFDSRLLLSRCSFACFSLTLGGCRAVNVQLQAEARGSPHIRDRDEEPSPGTGGARWRLQRLLPESRGRCNIFPCLSTQGNAPRPPPVKCLSQKMRFAESGSGCRRGTLQV